MSTISSLPNRAIVYPESDGQPMAENTIQFRWIVTIEGGLDGQFAADDNVFVAGDLFWYPVEGEPGIRQAPDILVAFGRPKGDRRSYKQWEEGGIPPRVVWEILSPGNRSAEMIRKFQFYERYGVDEYYIYDPENAELFGWLRRGDHLQEIPQMNGWVSPLLQIRFELVDGELHLYDRQGRRFATYLELLAQREQAEREAERAEHDRKQAERERERAERERERAEQDRGQALREKDRAIQQAAAQAKEMERMRAQLKALGVEP